MDQNKIKEHFRKVDPVIYNVMREMDLGQWWNRPKADYFAELCEDIIGQQLSGKAADSIFTRFVKLFPKKIITAEMLLTLTDQQVRDVGTSWAKVRSLKDLAERAEKKLIHFNKFDKLSDGEVMAELIKVKGVGPWTAEMFLIFTLHREDIFSLGDLGLNKAFKNLYGKKKLTAVVKRWSPYRSFGCLALWNSLDKV